jgi:hypothetical protein
MVQATLEQIDAFNMNPGTEWVIYFVEPTSGATAQTFARLMNYPEVGAYVPTLTRYKKALQAIVAVLDDENIPDFNASNRAEEIARRALLGD